MRIRLIRELAIVDGVSGSSCPGGAPGKWARRRAVPARRLWRLVGPPAAGGTALPGAGRGDRRGDPRRAGGPARRRTGPRQAAGRGHPHRPRR
ncbi:hypothetical protein C3Y87_13730 [Carbonactinospora thermoautotrophica]|nr:hypothetical protein [Carbonactinospora thermoautotrophica]